LPRASRGSGLTPVLFILSNAAIYEKLSAGIMPCDESWSGLKL
jgi:hypothetical protein